MRLEYEPFKTKEEIEFELLKEIELIELNEEVNEIEDLFNRVDFFKVGWTSGDKSILLSFFNNGRRGYHPFVLVKEHLNVGDFWIKDRSDFVKIDKECFDEDFIKRMKKLKGDEIFSLDIPNFDEITQEKIEEKIISEFKQIKKDFEEREILEFKEKETKEELEKRREKKYKEENKVKLEDKKVEIENNKIVVKEYDRDFKFVLKKNVNELISYYELKSIGGYKIYNKEFVDFLVSREINYTLFKKEENEEWIKIYNLEFNDLKINNIKIPKSKLGFILNRITIENNTEEQIKLWKTLTGMKLDFMNLEKINFHQDKFPIEVNILDKESFKVKFMDRDKVLNWVEVRDIFFDSGSRRSCRNSFYSPKDLFSLSSKFEIKKQELFDYTKKLRMLEKLK